MKETLSLHYGKPGFVDYYRKGWIQPQEEIGRRLDDFRTFDWGSVYQNASVLRSHGLTTPSFEAPYVSQSIPTSRWAHYGRLHE